MKHVTLSYYSIMLDEYLRKNGLRNSSSRIRLLEFLCDPSNGLDQHFEADAVASALNSRNTGVSRASVFRNFSLFCQIGILRKSKFGENHFHYELTGDDRKYHHHLICGKCGRYIEFEKGSFSGLAKKIAADNGFEMTDYRFEVFGTCPDCRKEK